jgi:hypothetical protein
MLRGADRPRLRPLVVETSIGGRVLNRREIPSDRWVSYDIAAPAAVLQATAVSTSA